MIDIHNFEALGFCLQRKLKQNIQRWPVFTGWCTAQPGLNSSLTIIPPPLYSPKILLVYKKWQISGIGLNPSLTIIPPRRYRSSTARANNDAVLNSLERRHALKIKEFWNKYSTTKYCWGEAPWPLEGLIKNSTRRSLSKSAAAFHSLGIICSLPQFNQGFFYCQSEKVFWKLCPLKRESVLAGVMCLPLWKWKTFGRDIYLRSRTILFSSHGDIVL